MTSAIEVTNQGMYLVRRLQFARDVERSAESELNSARCAVANAENELVKWLVPMDAKFGDVFVLPVGDAFLDVIVAQSTARGVESGERSTEKSFTIRWRGNRPPKDPIR